MNHDTAKKLDTNQMIAGISESVGFVAAEPAKAATGAKTKGTSIASH